MLQLTVVSLLLLTILPANAAPVSARVRPENRAAFPFRVLASDRSGVSLEYESPGLVPVAGAAVAIPDGAVPRLTWSVARHRTLSPSESSFVADRPGRPGETEDTETVTFHEDGILRRFRVGRLSVRPVYPDPVTSAAILAQVIRIRVDFVFPAGSLPAGGEVGRESQWDDTYSHVFINAEAARTFPRSTRPSTPPHRTDQSETGNPEFRVRVPRTGLYSLSFSELRALGWPDDLPVEDIRFYEKSPNSADPSHPEEEEGSIWIDESGGSPGVFDGDDRILFYGLDRSDRFSTGFRDARYSRVHTYWLSFGPGPHERMGKAPGWSEDNSFTTPSSFTETSHFEEDGVYAWDIPPVIPGEYPDVDTNYWLPITAFHDSLEFALPDVDPSGSCRFRARWQGFSLSTHFVGLDVGACGGPTIELVHRHAFPEAESYTFESGPVPIAAVSSGCNRLHVHGNGFVPGDPDSPGSGALFDWFEVTWPRKYVARDGRLEFTSGGVRGPIEMAVRGLGTSNLLLFDISDPRHPKRIDPAETRITSLGGHPQEFELRFRPAPVDAERTWIVFEHDAVPAIDGEAIEIPPDLGTGVVVRDASIDAAEGVGADVLVLTHPQFTAALQPWVDYRASQGHRIRVVTTQDVWNEFSGGDKSVPAIRAWLRWCFREWLEPPSFLLLFGDASEDYRKAVAESDPDWVPTMMKYAPVPGFNLRSELAGSDNYYVGSLAPGDRDDDVVPDMHMGRLPVGSTAEANAVVAKILAYENHPAGDEPWRSRGLIVSDDRYSKSYLGNARYCRSDAEDLFEAGGDSLARILGRNTCGAPFEVDHFRLAAYLDSVSGLGRTFGTEDCPDPSATLEYTRRYVTPHWLERTDPGELFVIFSGHGSRTSLTSEDLVEFNGFFTTPSSRVPEQLTNYGRPFIFIGASCHLNEFEYFQERDSEHSIGEEMVLLPGRGAIASIASTAFEYTFTSEPTEVELGRTIFDDPVIDPRTGRPARILGAAFDEAMVRLSFQSGGGPFRDLLKTYCLLGDPLLRIDRAAPVIDIAADGATLSGGQSVSSSPGGSTARLTARMTDDVDAGRIEIVDDGEKVPGERIEITTLPDSSDRCSGFRVTYVPTLEPGTYSIVFRSSDWLGRTTERVVPVVLAVDYRLDGRPVVSGQVVSGAGALEVHLKSPVPLTRDRIEILSNGNVLPLAFEADDAEGREWTGRNLSRIPDGSVTLETRIDGETARADGAVLTVLVVSAVSLANVFFYPSPWEGHGDGRFVFDVTLPPEMSSKTATVTVFSVSGRPVRTLTIPITSGRNSISWDMRDSRGDAIANGVYLFKIAIDSEKNASVVDRFVVHR